MKNARAKRAKILFFIVNYANLWGFCCRRRRGCLSSLLNMKISRRHLVDYDKKLHQTACRKCITITFSTNQIIDL